MDAIMNLIVKILVGGIIGYLTGKTVDAEGSVIIRRKPNVADIFLGAIGACFGEYLFFWVVIGKGSFFTDFATTILGSITFVGAARLLSRRFGSRYT
jgi:uncharacterized membrane protein YeaQ/YmgE (transglycosylase-associated protein family)